MSWGVDRGALEAGRDEMLSRVAQRWAHPWLEQLGRAHRWLDEEEDAVRCFREAAEDVERRIEDRGRGDAHSRGQTGSLLRLAGEREAAAEWFARALEGTRESDAIDVAAYCYLLDDPRAALAAAATRGGALAAVGDRRGAGQGAE